MASHVHRSASPIAFSLHTIRNGTLHRFAMFFLYAVCHVCAEGVVVERTSGVGSTHAFLWRCSATKLSVRRRTLASKHSKSSIDISSAAVDTGLDGARSRKLVSPTLVLTDAAVAISPQELRIVGHNAMPELP